MKNNVLLSLFLLANIGSFSAHAQPITSPQIDALVQRVLTTFDVPGIAVAVVKDGSIIHAKVKPISPLTDFSFDFQDLDLQRVK